MFPCLSSSHVALPIPGHPFPFVAPLLGRQPIKQGHTLLMACNVGIAANRYNPPHSHAGNASRFTCMTNMDVRLQLLPPHLDITHQAGPCHAATWLLSTSGGRRLFILNRPIAVVGNKNFIAYESYVSSLNTCKLHKYQPLSV